MPIEIEERLALEQYQYVNIKGVGDDAKAVLKEVTDASKLVRKHYKGRLHDEKLKANALPPKPAPKKKPKKDSPF